MFRATVSGIKVGRPVFFWDRKVEASTKEKLKVKIALVRKQMKSKGFTVQVEYEPPRKLTAFLFDLSHNKLL